MDSPPFLPFLATPFDAASFTSCAKLGVQWLTNPVYALYNGRRTGHNFGLQRTAVVQFAVDLRGHAAPFRVKEMAATAAIRRLAAMFNMVRHSVRVLPDVPSATLLSTVGRLVIGTSFPLCDRTGMVATRLQDRAPITLLPYGSRQLAVCSDMARCVVDMCSNSSQAQIVLIPTAADDQVTASTLRNRGGLFPRVTQAWSSPVATVAKVVRGKTKNIVYVYDASRITWSWLSHTILVARGAPVEIRLFGTTRSACHGMAVADPTQRYGAVWTELLQAARLWARGGTSNVTINTSQLQIEAYQTCAEFLNPATTAVVSDWVAREYADYTGPIGGLTDTTLRLLGAAFIRPDCVPPLEVTVDVIKAAWDVRGKRPAADAPAVPASYKSGKMPKLSNQLSAPRC